MRVVCVWLRIRDGERSWYRVLQLFATTRSIHLHCVPAGLSLSALRLSLTIDIASALPLTARTRYSPAGAALSLSLSLSRLWIALSNIHHLLSSPVSPRNRTAQKTYLAVAISLAGASFGPSTGSRAEGAQPIWRVVSRAHCAISLTAAASLSGSSSYRGVNMKPPTGTK